MSITNKEIYNGALALIGELNGNYDCEDYEEHAPYLLASFCSLASDLDKKLREIDNLETASAFSHVFLSLDSVFPLCDRFVPLATMYLGAMLVIDDDPDLSDSIYEKYCDAISDISATIAAELEAIKAASEPEPEPEPEPERMAICESIVEKYFFD